MKTRILLAAAIAAIIFTGPLQAQDTAPHPESTSAALNRSVDAAASASRQQGEAIATMADLLRRLGDSDAIHAARRELDDIVKAQSTLAGGTTDVAKTTVGQRPDELSPDLKKRLDEMAQQQHALGDRTQKVLDDMKKAIEQLTGREPADAQTLQNTLDLARQNHVTGEQKLAGEGLTGNQLSQVGGSQGRAIAGLKQMIAELDKIEQRKLLELQRQLADLIEQVRNLRSDEIKVHTASITAGNLPADAIIDKLADRQGTVQANALIVEKAAEITPDALAAAGDIRAAGTQMALAAGTLYAHQQPDALPPETESIALLDSAIKRLEKQQRQVGGAIKDQDLAAIIAQYQAIRASQATLKTTSDQTESRRQAAGDLGRADIMELARLASTQKDLADHVVALSSDDRLKEYAVVVWMNGQIAIAMNASRDRLTHAQPGPELALVQSTAIDRLTDLIAALQEEKGQPPFTSPTEDPECKCIPDPKPGSNPPGKQPLLKTLAQLKLIKAMQSVVNAQTASVNDALKTAANDDQKNELRDRAAKLGQTQSELRSIFEKLVQDSR